MKATYIDYSETNSFSPAVIRYLDQDPDLEPFISYKPNIEGFTQILHDKTVVADRAALVEVLQEQYSGFTTPEYQNSKLVAANIDLLSRDTTYTITTGHQ